MKKYNSMNLYVMAMILISFMLTISLEITENVKADTQKKYTVMYSGNRGYGVPSSQTKYENEPLTLSTVEPMRNGYVFMGWSTDSSSSRVDYRPGDTYSKNSSITLYAVWGVKDDSTGKVSYSTNKSSSSGGGTSTSTNVKTNKITASSKTVTYNSKSFNLKAKAKSGVKLSYKSSNKKVATVSKMGKVTVKGYGKTTVTIKALAGKGYSAATKKITVKVVPKKMKITETGSPGKGKVHIAWKTDKSISAYQLQLSRYKNFKGDKYDISLSKSKSKITTPKLKSGKIYYIRIRSYKKVGNKKYYGKWSQSEKIKIK